MFKNLGQLCLIYILVLFSTHFVYSQEICGDGIDNDGDLAIDEVCDTFICDGVFYQTMGIGSTRHFYKIETNPAQLIPISNLSSNGLIRSINSIAYNRTDNFIYGIDDTSPYHLYRIDRDGDLEYLGNITGITGMNQAGTMGSNGEYWVTGASGRLYLIDLATRVATLVGTIGTTDFGDIAYNPLDGLLYGWEKNSRRLMQIDPTTAVATNIGPINTRWVTFGAMYFNTRGEIIAYGNDGNITSSNQETLAKINASTGLVTGLGTDINSNGNDGCACSFGIEMTKSAPLAVSEGDTFTYTFKIYNGTGQPLGGVSFVDSLTEGLSWVSEPQNLHGVTIISSPISGTAKAKFILNTIQPGIDSFTIDVAVPCNYTGVSPYLNQALLSNLPSLYGDTLYSDDPNTAIITDSTATVINPSQEACTPLSCDGAFYQTLTLAGDKIFSRINLNPLQFSTISNLTANGIVSINSIGYNPIDNFIYGINEVAPYQLYKIDANGDFTLLGNVTGLTGSNHAGTIGPVGEYWVTGQAGNLYLVDIATQTASLVGNMGAVNFGDIAYNPIDGKLYGWEIGTRQLMQIDPTTVAVVAIGASNPQWATFGAVYFNTQGELIAYGDDATNTGSVQETLVKIDVATGVVTPIGTGPNSIGNDGCSCSFGIEMTKSAPTIIDAGQALTYTFKIFNQTGQIINNLQFQDQLTNGLFWASGPQNVHGLQVVGGLPIDGQTLANLTLNNVQPGVDSFTLDALIPCAYAGATPYQNQAILVNTPNTYADTIYSDNPNTTAIADSTATTINLVAGACTLFKCEGRFYQTLQQAGNMRFFEVETNPINFIQVSDLTALGLPSTINSIAYNPVDNFIYGINNNSPYQLYRIDATGNFTHLGNVTGLSGSNEGGTFGPNGEYYVSGASGRLYQINISSRVATLIGTIGGFDFDDIAYNPNDGFIYGWDANGDRLRRIDPSNAAFTNIGPSNPTWEVMGALYFNAQGELIGYGDNSTIAGGQESLVRVDHLTGAVTSLGTGPITSVNDGCSCPFGIALTKASPDTVSAGNIFTYTFKVFNRTEMVLNNILFEDILNNGLTWASEPQNPNGLTFGSSNITGNSNAQVFLNNVQPGTDSFTINVQVPCLYTGDSTYKNRAYLMNLLSSLPDTINSDDPNSLAIEDSTTTIILPNGGACEPFSCDGQFYQTILRSGDMRFYRVEPDPVTFVPISNLTALGLPASINSIAYNPVDNFIYGIHDDSPHQCHRIDANGNLTYLGNVTGLPNDTYAGCMDANGVYYVTGRHGRLYTIDLTTLTATLIGTHGADPADIAYNPDDGQLYGFDMSTDRLMRIDPITVNTTYIGASSTQFRAFGAMYFNTQGKIIAYGDDQTISSTDQESLVQIDPYTGVISVLGIGLNTNGNDGCSCTFGIDMTKAGPSSVSDNNTFRYTFKIFNRTATVLNGLDFQDVLANGLVWASEPQNVHGVTISGAALTGTSMANLNISNVQPGLDSFTIDVFVPCGYVGANPYANQATLGNLPAPYPSSIVSDDPNTLVIDDATNTSISTGSCVLLNTNELIWELSKVEKTAVLDWEIEELHNIRSFEVERSQDGINWEVITVQKTGYQQQNYQYIDNNTLQGIAYYRIVSTDQHHQQYYSATKAIVFEQEGQVISVYPNPVKEELTIVINEYLPNIKFLILDGLGRVIQTGQLTSTINKIETKNLAKGVYFLQLKGDVFSQVTKIIKQ